MNGGMNNMHQCGQKCQKVKCWNWEVRQFTTVHQQNMEYAVLILNRPISQSPEFIRKFWNNASVRMTVDGGTLRWETFLNTLSEDIQQSLKLPDLITGDFDSISHDVLEQYEKKGCKTIHTPDQNHTDFTKALIELNTYCKQQKLQIENIIAIGQNSGRIDQILGNIQTLFLAQDKHLVPPTSKVYIMSDDSVSWLLSPGDHIINIPEKVIRHKRAWCCLAPIGQTCERITTSGLKWNLNNQSLRFGELVSTSNAFEGSDKVKIKCSHPVLWSMKIPDLTLGP